MFVQKYNWSYSKPRETKGGIRLRTKRGRMTSSNWWSGRWMRILDECIDSGRLSRGRSYARKGQVTNIEISPGRVIAFVQGTKKTPYRISLVFETVSEEAKEMLLMRFREHSSFAARLLAGEMPKEMEAAFMEAGIPLFPKRAEMRRFRCTCPDSTVTCKHMVAVLLLMAEVIDDDPFLLLKLRGIDRERLIALLTSETSSENQESESDGGSYFEDWDCEGEVIGGCEVDEAADTDVPPADDKWFGGDVPVISYTEDSARRLSALEVMNDFPFWRGEVPFRKTLTPCYERAANRAFEILTGEKKSAVGRPRKLI